MAYSTLVSLEKSITQILYDDNYSISRSQKAQILSIEKHCVSFRAYLEHFPDISKDLEERIRAAAAEAEDIIEMFMVEQIRFDCICTIWILYLKGIRYGYELKKVRNVMDSMAGEMVEIKSSIKVKDLQLSDPVEAGSSSEFEASGEIQMVGLDENLIEIKDQLCGYEPHLQILPISGMGGIGKTTLARNAYGDGLIMEHFQVRAWVAISQDYDKRRILLDLLDSMKEFDPDRGHGSMKEEEGSEEENEHQVEIRELTDGEMMDKVYKILFARRFLIVMDDVWSTDVLDYVRRLFPDNRNGSRIMLTTRLAVVASYAHSSLPVHEMSLMDDDQSWNLLQQKVFSHQDGIPRGFEKIGREIARNCRGLPLAIVVVAGLLATASKTLIAWEEIANIVSSSLATTDGHIEKILSLSYNHLPRHLRSCFLYMGVFPEDHEIRVADLARLWIAEGFVIPVVSKRLEQTAEEYLEDLVDRNLIVVTKRKSNGEIKSCSLHDMVREICIKLSQEEKFLVHIAGTVSTKFMRSIKDRRRVILSTSDLDAFSSISSTNVRTIMCFHDTPGCFESFKLLRVLNMLRVRFTPDSLPDQFFELFRLRYLAFCYDEPIPSEISNLQCLETLIIKASKYHPLPLEIWNLTKLRHLIVSGCCLLEPSSGSSLPNLQTLRKVKNLICSFNLLIMIQGLKKLHLTFFRVSGDLLLHKLYHLYQLVNLQLELETNLPNVVKPVLKAPKSLKKLTLIGWGCYTPHMTIECPLPNLEVLKLIRLNFREQNWSFCHQSFPKLKFLLLEGTNLKRWNFRDSHFMTLKTLILRACWHLHEFPNDIVDISTLELIELQLCSKSLAASANQVLEERQDNGDYAFQVRCVDCQDIDVHEVDEFTERLNRLRAPKKITKRKLKSRRTRNLMLYGVIPKSSEYYRKVEYDYSEADSKIVDYKDDELQFSIYKFGRKR